MPPDAKSEASGEFARPSSPHQAIEFFIGNGGVPQQRGDPPDDLDRLGAHALPRPAVDGEALWRDRGQPIRPANFQWAAKANELGRGVEGWRSNGTINLYSTIVSTELEPASFGQIQPGWTAIVWR
jgi:hypothetical protein